MKVDLDNLRETLRHIQENETKTTVSAAYLARRTAYGPRELGHALGRLEDEGDVVQVAYTKSKTYRIEVGDDG